MKSKPVKSHSEAAAPRFPDRLKNLKKRDVLVGDPEDIVHMDWSSEWTELRNLEPGSQPPKSKRRSKP